MIKKVVYILLFVSILVGCNSLAQNSKQICTKRIIIKDSSDYTQKFLNDLNQEGIEVKFLIDSLYIIGEEDTVIFPDLPLFEEWGHFTGRKDNIVISVRVKRMTQNSIKYYCEIVEFGNSNNITEGIAEFGPFFYIGAESDENTFTGNLYLSTEYTNEKDNCYTSIRIGRDDESGQVMCKLIKNCNGKIMDISLDNFPTLKRK